MHRAPEVYRREPYNDRCDVFSFAIMAYEIMGRSMLAYTHVGTRPAEISQVLSTPDMYAARSASGYRPPRIKMLSDAAWELVCAAWHDDPLERPPMVTVMEELRLLAEEQEAAAEAAALQAAARPSCGCAIS